MVYRIRHTQYSLLDFGLSEIPEEEAGRLLNQTFRDTNGQYHITLAVFHQLHCVVSMLVSPKLMRLCSILT